MALGYVRRLPACGDASLTLLRDTVLDVMGCRSAEIWAEAPDGTWSQVASAGSPMTLPDGYASWDAINIQASLAGHVVCPISTAEGPGHHFATGSLWSAGQFQVLHVVAPIRDAQVACAEAFLRVIASVMLDVAQSASRVAGVVDVDPPPLTERQQRILALMVAGKTYQQIAADVGFSESTIKQETGRIREHLGVHDRKAAVARAVLGEEQPALP